LSPCCLSLPPPPAQEPRRDWCHTMCWDQQWFLSWFRH
jgi:hypothetical protein